MVSTDIRRKFMDFFRENQHKIVPSAPMVIKNDPTLMFTNAGMNQFKDYFLGNKPAPYSRVADTQKCLRVSGKHNDLDEVGLDTYHHTMFEMLGNWSFGDYFKQEAIGWAWELLTQEFGLDKSRLYVTYFGGDDEDKLSADQEAQELWGKHLDPAAILPFGKKDNFWEMGDTGPCGPCSEVHYDMRSDKEREEVPGASLVNMDHPQVIEIWNLVFIQYNRLASGKLDSLPEKHVDTGMGFERLVRVIQGKHSNYDTDLFTPLIDKIGELAGISYGDNPQSDIAMRVISDHVRALAFAIADGEMPSNSKAGYVIRRILRRAVRYGYTFLGFKDPAMFKLVPVLAETMGEIFQELSEQKEFISKVIKEEEKSFLRTLANGISRFHKYLEQHKHTEKIDGDFAFELYDTYGFPVDLTELMAREQKIEVDLDGFNAAMVEQKNRSRDAQEKEESDWIKVSDGNEVEFVGYHELESKAKVLRYRQVQMKNKTIYQLVLNQTPFYAESGGQVGDTGTLKTSTQSIPVWDTRRENDLVIHMVNELPNPIDAELSAQVHREKRIATENNHSATHLLHAALRKVLGPHVQQRGSLVNEKVLRFDFSHFGKMTAEEISEVEHLVNKQIRKNVARDVKEHVPIEEAKSMGATALFGEKYGEFVRVVSFDPDYSIELCGGTHVSATGQIGLFKILAESSIASGVRRIEAVTAKGAEDLVSQRFDELQQVSELLKNPKDTLKAIQSLIDERNEIQHQLERVNRQALQELKSKLISQVTSTADHKHLFAQIDLPDAQALKDLSFELKNKIDGLFAVLAADVAGKPQIAVVVSDRLVKDYNWNAGEMVRKLAQHISGGGGGQPFFATAGGKNLSGLPKVIEEAEKMHEALLLERKENH